MTFDSRTNRLSLIAANEISVITRVGHTEPRDDDDDGDGDCDGTDFGLLF